MDTFDIGKLTFGIYPRVVAIIDEIIPDAELMQLRERGADLLEIRFDSFTEEWDTVFSYIQHVKELAKVPLLGTLRENDRTRIHRLSLFLKIIPLVDLVDIEVESPDASSLDKLINKCIPVMISHHDFVKTPADADLAAMLLKAQNLEADIFKVALMAQNEDDVRRLMKFVENCPLPIAGFSMGEYGAISRVLGSLYGSLFSYGYIGKPNAPGQLSLDELNELFGKFYPERFVRNKDIQKCK